MLGFPLRSSFENHSSYDSRDDRRRPVHPRRRHARARVPVPRQALERRRAGPPERRPCRIPRALACDRRDQRLGALRPARRSRAGRADRPHGRRGPAAGGVLPADRPRAGVDAGARADRPVGARLPARGRMTLPDGFAVGHWTDEQARTGCTVVLVPQGTRGAVEVRGGGTGSRELEAVSPHANSEGPTAVLLTGGSAFGLAAADGVVSWLEERGLGRPTPLGVIPLVPAAVVFDLAEGTPARRPGP